MIALTKLSQANQSNAISPFDKPRGVEQLAVGNAVRKSEYRRDIDGLRAVAVICVIINHLNHAAMPGGYLGVDVFFVISGYVITASLEKTTYSSLGSQLLHFYSRRIKRLMPALLTMTFLASAAIHLFDPFPQISVLTGVVSIFGSSNIFLFWQATNYFGTGAQRNMFAHTWSLGVEEQFYFLYPFLFRWRRPIDHISLWDDRLRLGALTALSVASLVLFIVVYPSNQPAAYFLMPCRFWELGLGCIMALVAKVYETRGIDRPIPIHGAIPLIAMVPAMLLAGSYPISCTILVVVATTVLIGSLREETAVYKTLASRPFTYIGAISYSLYLWHWPVICLSFWTIGIHLWSLPFQIALMLLLAMASYHFIENPLRRATWAPGGWSVLAIGIPSMIVIAGLIMAGQKYSLPRFTGQTATEVATADTPSPGYIAPYSHRKIDDCFASSVFDGNAQDLDRNLERCSAGTNPKLKLVFLGDSHAMDLFPMADHISHDGIATVTNVFQPGCKIVPIDPGPCAYPFTVMDRLATGQSQNVILVLRENSSPRSVSGDLVPFAKALQEFLDHASADHMKVIYIAPAPKYNSLDSLCAPQWFRPASTMGPQCRNGFLEEIWGDVKGTRVIFTLQPQKRAVTPAH